MDVKKVLNEVIKEHCPFIHNNRLNALLDVAEGLTVKDKKIYSYFTLGKFIIEFNYLHTIKPLLEPLASIIKTELCRALISWGYIRLREHASRSKQSISNHFLGLLRWLTPPRNDEL